MGIAHLTTILVLKITIVVVLFVHLTLHLLLLSYKVVHACASDFSLLGMLKSSCIHQCEVSPSMNSDIAQVRFQIRDV